MESWFLGDLAAVEKGMNLKQGKLSKLQNNQKYRNPDEIHSPKEELKRIAPNYQQISGSRAISKYLNIENNKSHSFNIFVRGLKKILLEISTNN